MKRIFKVSLMLSLLLNSIDLYAKLGGSALVDSLMRELPRQREDSNKVKLLNDIAFGYSSTNPDDGIKYALQGLELAKKLDFQRGIAFMNSCLGLNYMAKAEYNKALEYLFAATKQHEKIGDKQGLAGTCSNMGNVYRHTGEYPKALQQYFKAIKLSEETGNQLGAAIYTGNIGNIYFTQQNYQKALEYYSKALKLDQVGGYTAYEASVTGNIGAVYLQQGNDSTALVYCSRALKLYERLGDKQGIATNNSNLGGLYFSRKEYAKAINCFRRTSQIGAELGDKATVALGQIMTGQAYLEMAGDSNINGKAGLLQNSIAQLERALLTLKDVNAPDYLQECYGSLKDAYKLKGEYAKALNASDHWHAIQDSLFSKENNEQIIELGVKNEYDKKHLADSLKAAEKTHLSALRLQRQKNYTYVGFAGILLLVGFSFFIVKERGKSEKERKKSDELLLNILPEEVAKELKTSGTTPAKLYDNVTVLFTDFVNFTLEGAKMLPQDLIDELHACFKAFDEITAKYNIEKIKTIGDAYLAVAGLPTADPLHAEHAVKAALEINEFMQDRLSRRGSKTFGIRIGIHSGSVVAGIVGVKKFAYDIWGDTVNTAARMEQNSIAGKINISQTTYEQVKDLVNCNYRGEIEAKGKGQMKMYYVEGVA